VATFEKRVKIGPKGQVVIPKYLRDEFHLAPGDEVLLGTDGTKVTLTPATDDPIAFFERLAKSGKGRRGPIEPHESEREIEERHLRRRR